eukprot:GDKI01002295.1.p1 GENE.GDKI01002295.1~~GDKI01002295.1.p1  ORF type:complete len:112 (-),score=16.82 GDKI01002295.1:151-486(-)
MSSLTSPLQQQTYTVPVSSDGRLPVFGQATPASHPVSRHDTQLAAHPTTESGSPANDTGRDALLDAAAELTFTPTSHGSNAEAEALLTVTDGSGNLSVTDGVAESDPHAKK